MIVNYPLTQPARLDDIRFCTNIKLSCGTVSPCSCVDADTFRVALDHILARAGTGVPTGRAEKFLAFLCQQGDVLWQFLDKYTADVRNTDGVQETTRHLARKTGHEAVLSDHSVKRVTSPDQVGVDAENDQGNRNPRDISFSLAQLSKALCTYRHERGEEAVEIGEATVQDLTNFLYLDGQTKVTPCRTSYDILKWNASGESM